MQKTQVHRLLNFFPLYSLRVKLFKHVERKVVQFQDCDGNSQRICIFQRMFSFHQLTPLINNHLQVFTNKNLWELHLQKDMKKSIHIKILEFHNLYRKDPLGNLSMDLIGSIIGRMRGRLPQNLQEKSQVLMSKPEDICNNFGKNMLLFMLRES